LNAVGAIIIVVFLVRAARLSEVIMDDHRPTSSGRAGEAGLEAGHARRQNPRGTERAKRLESERGLPVHESTHDQVRRAFEAAGIVFMDSDRGRGMMLLNAALPPPKWSGYLEKNANNLQQF
jgi:hypothetical protein